MPDLKGLLRCQIAVAEREGLAPPSPAFCFSFLRPIAACTKRHIEHSQRIPRGPKPGRHGKEAAAGGREKCLSDAIRNSHARTGRLRLYDEAEATPKPPDGTPLRSPHGHHTSAQLLGLDRNPPASTILFVILTMATARPLKQPL